MKVLFNFLVIFVYAIGVANAQTLRVPSFFSDNMVLQQNADVKFWGWAKAGQKVKVIPSWSNDTVIAVTTGDAEWKTTLATPTAGGPYHIAIQSQGQELILDNVLIGEVWLCSGQSNMQWSALNNLKEMKVALPTITNPKIRFLQVSNIAAQTPQNDIYDKWTECNPQTAESFSAIGYFFAEKLYRELDVPIGIINTSWGGTSAEYWTPKEVIEADKELLANAGLQKVAPRKPYQPGVLWNSMVHPLAGYELAGALWYQGEDNTVSYWGYDKLMKALVSSWRAAWNKEFPFYFVQIAPYAYKYDTPNAALLREQQSVTALTLPKSAMVVTTDLVDNIKDIHPQQKKAVASRLADIALVNDYGFKKVDFQSPIYKEHIVEGNKIRIRFAHLQGKLQIRGKAITDLFIAGEDKIFVPAACKIEGNELVVYATTIKKPLAVRFGFSNTATPNLFTDTGLPVAPFRTDQWDSFRYEPTS